MKFSKALKQVKAGRQVARASWKKHRRLITLYQARIIVLGVDEYEHGDYEIDFCDDGPKESKREMNEWLDGFAYKADSDDLLADDWQLA